MTRRWGAVALTLSVCLAGPAAAATHEGSRIVAVEVRGASAVANETVLAKVQTKPGAPYSEAAVSEDIRRLFALGYFTDVRADVEELPEGLKLVFVVLEKPSIAAVEFKGNRRIPKQKITELFGVRAGELYDPRKVKEGVDQVEAEYGRKGFSEAKIATDARQDAAANDVTIFVLIDEGPRMRITRILVEGNQAFSDHRIRKILKTKRRKWLFAQAYDAQILREDLDRIRAFYRKNGYQDVAAESSVSRDPNGKGLTMLFTVQEGMQHRVGQVAVDGNVLFPEREIRQIIRLKPGAVYSPDALQEDLRGIKEYYGDRGYIHAQVTPDPQLDPETKRVRLTYHITEEELAYVNRIDIRGNLMTRDEVIRRDLRIYPGERFDGAKIRKSVDRLYNLGFFEEVTVDTQPTGEADAEDLIVQVKETKTGSFSFGGGFSSVDKLVGLVELEQRNFDWRNWPQFTGAGQDLRLRIEAGTVRRYFDVSFTEPWWFGHPVSFGIDAYNRTRLRSQNLGLAFQEERRGAGFRLGKELADVASVGTDYQLFRTVVSDVVDDASADLKAEQGRTLLSVAGLSLAYDRRNNRLDPTDGAYVFATGNVAGGPFGGDRDFYRLQSGGSYYWPHGEDDTYVLEARMRAGVVQAYGDSDEVPIFERFFGGGSTTIRGFEERKVGPRDPVSSDPIGGEAIFAGTLEEVVTLARDDRSRPILRGAAFYDIGNVWRRAGQFADDFKAGTGVGVRVQTPIGPVRLDLGFPISDVAGEKRKPRLHFNISRTY